jgi:hypothetical protein
MISITYLVPHDQGSDFLQVFSNSADNPGRVLDVGLAPAFSELLRVDLARFERGRPATQSTCYEAHDGTEAV